MREGTIFDPRCWYRTLTNEKARYTLAGKTKVAMPMLAFMAVYGIVFVLIEHWNRLHYTIIHMAVDDMIPFWEVFIIPYVLWFAYVSLFTVYLLFRDETSYHRTCTFLAAGMAAFLLVSILFPNIHFLRPEVMPRDNVFTRMVSMIYAADTPTNLTPSIHVFNSLAVMEGVRHQKEGIFARKAARIPMYVLGILIVLSTMFIKQHSFSDVLIGIGLACVLHVLVYRFDFLFISPKRTKRVYNGALSQN